MNLVALDFETYFADDYTLSKMTTEAYVRDPRFKAHCVGVKFAGAKEPTIVYDEPRGVLAAQLREASIVVHHAHFDGLILSHHYGIKPAFWFDTLSMARLVFPHAKSHSLKALAEMLGLPPKTVPYNDFKNIRDLPPELYNRVAIGCANDVELTYAIFQKLLPLVPKDELRIIDLTVRLFTEPLLRLDRAKLMHYLDITRGQKDTMLSDLGVTREDLQSADRMAGLLQALGVEPPTKISAKTGKVAYAFAKTDALFTGLLDHEDERVSGLVAARLGVKSNMVETRAQRMLDMDTRGPMCVYLKYCGAHTMRWSGGDSMNWQNFKRGSVLRDAVLAPPGHVICVVDAAQIECRVLNWLAGQNDVLDKFRRREDIYSELATKFYGEPVDKSKPEKRGTGKQIELSCGFRAGADSIKNTARIGLYGPPVMMTDEQAKAARDLYRSTHPRVQAMWRWCDKVLLPVLLGKSADYAWGPLRCKGARIIAPNGAALDYSNLGLTQNKWGQDQFYTTSRRGVKNMHGGILTQNVVELLARMILSEAMLLVARNYRIVTCTHDEMVYLAPDGGAQLALDFGLWAMQKPPAWCPDIPLDAEGGFARNYSK